MKMATGDYFVLGDHDDVFEPDTLFECARAINSKEKPDMIYSDEDKITEDGKSIASLILNRILILIY